MEEEIKEKIKAYYVANDIDEILDYITNLQEELYSTNQVVRELLDIQERNEKATTYYYKTLSEYNNQNKKMPDEAVEMFNLLENNK